MNRNNKLQQDAGLLNTKQAADYLGLSPGTLMAWRYQQRGPTYCKIGGSVRYRKDDLDSFAGRNVKRFS